MMIIMDYDDDGAQDDLGLWDDGRFMDLPSLMAVNKFRRKFWGHEDLSTAVLRY